MQLKIPAAKTFKKQTTREINPAGHRQNNRPAVWQQ